MKKTSKVLTVILAALLIATLLPGTAFAADLQDVSESGTIGGDTTVDKAVINVVVPTNVNFALNPLEIGQSGNQVTTADYILVNKSNVPVAASFYLDAVLGTGVT
ncbi:MAG: hypothetical protein LBQ16_03455, partial [Gracilibacteraceae bacterium]|nr:hypothetical protein [Gracilibacteraceae bacterium]